MESTSSFSYSSAAIDHLVVFKISDDDSDVAADENTVIECSQVLAVVSSTSTNSV